MNLPGAPLSNLQALIFDFDGLIIDSERLEADCIIEIVAEWGHTMSYADFGHLFGSVDADEQWDELLERYAGCRPWSSTSDYGRSSRPARTSYRCCRACKSSSMLRTAAGYASGSVWATLSRPLSAGSAATASSTASTPS